LTNEKRLCIGLIILVVVLVTASLFHTEFVYPASAETDKSLNIQVDDLPNCLMQQKFGRKQILD
jgi:hypothetical protein